MEDIRTIKQRFEIIGNDIKLNRAIEKAIQVAPTDFTVLITGESGVGKEIFPRIIHSFSTRKHAQYIAVNCGGIPEGTIDSELFGHEKGSFTGALSDRKGYFEVSDGGTIFLDEVGELPLSTQAKLLRVLEAGVYPGRIVESAKNERASNCRHERGPTSGCQEREVQRRPLLPDQHDPDLDPRTTGPERRYIPPVSKIRG